VNVETKAVDAHILTKQAEKVQTLPARRLMATVFWDREGLLMAEFMQQGTTVTPDVYCKTPKKLCRATQNERCGMLTSSVVLLHDK
jgi:hypothetical protein